MNVTRISLCVVMVFVLVGVVEATQIQVPDQYLCIQDAINMASDGDTISVWVHTVPPDTYYENVNFLGKSIFVVNRSFLQTKWR